MWPNQLPEVSTHERESAIAEANVVTKVISSNLSNNAASMLKDLASELDGKGQIKLAFGDMNGTVVPGQLAYRASFCSMGKVEKMLSRLGMQAAIDKRSDVFGYIRDIIKTSNVADGDRLIANIRKAMNTTGKLRGKDVAAAINLFLKDAKSLEGTPVATAPNQTINLINKPPLQIQGDHAIVRFATLGKAVRANKSLSTLVPKLHTEMDKILKDRGSASDPRGAGELFSVQHDHLACKDVTVMADLAINGAGYQNTFIQIDDLKAMYKQALNGKSGDIVLEPFPDDLTKRGENGKQIYQYSDKNLHAMLDAVNEAIKNAKNKNALLRVAIATDNQALLNRISELRDAPTRYISQPGRFQT